MQVAMSFLSPVALWDTYFGFHLAGFLLGIFILEYFPILCILLLDYGSYDLFLFHLAVSCEYAFYSASSSVSYGGLWFADLVSFRRTFPA